MESNETTLQTTDTEVIDQARKHSELQHQYLSALVKNTVEDYCKAQFFSNGLSYNEKIQSLNALTEAITFVLDFGLSINKVELRTKGRLSKEANGIASVLLNAFDNRFMLLADNIRRRQLAEAESCHND